MYECLKKSYEDILQWMKETEIPNITEIFENTFITELDDAFNEAEKRLEYVDGEFLQKTQPVLTQIKQVKDAYRVDIGTGEFVLECTSFRMSIFEQQELLQIYRDRVKEAWAKSPKIDLDKCIHVRMNTPFGWKEISNDSNISNLSYSIEDMPIDQRFKRYKKIKGIKYFQDYEIAGHIVGEKEYGTIEKLESMREGELILIQKEDDDNCSNSKPTMGIYKAPNLFVYNQKGEFLGRLNFETREELLELDPFIEAGFLHKEKFVVIKVQKRTIGKKGYPVGLPLVKIQTKVTETEGGKSV